MTEHSYQNSKPAVDDAPQRAAVSMAASAEATVVRRTTGILVDADAAPMIGRFAQARGTGGAHLYQAGFATRFGDRRGPDVRAQSVIIAGGQRLGGLREHRDGHHSPDSGQGLENLDVAMLLGVRFRRWPLAQLRQERVLPRDAPLTLGVDDPQPWNQQQDRLARRLAD